MKRGDSIPLPTVWEIGNGLKRPNEVWYPVRISTGRYGIVREISGGERTEFIPKVPHVRELLDSSATMPELHDLQNAGRSGVEVVITRPCDSMPQRLFFWDDGRQWAGPAPGSPAYGPDGVDTGW